MSGPPKDVEGQCNAWLVIADDYGDNIATIRCQLKPGHEGLHLETYKDSNKGSVKITWEKDHSVLCEKHGRTHNAYVEETPKCEECYQEELELASAGEEKAFNSFLEDPRILEYPDAKLFAFCWKLEKEIQTTSGEVIFLPEGSDSCHAFFIDQEPEANWAHKCTYVFFTEEVKNLIWIDSEWPPSEDFPVYEITSYLRKDK